ncbi:MAG: TetR/AcrR family transcriptional regulator [Eubacteriaceae bacterium]|nr:TetR/AcrR family transcriptional regulator [Eubacteriaceae bacterium]
MSDMRERIIDTAIEDFTQNGLKFTMNDLAKALGISKKTIYTLFDSKQDLLMGIADRYTADFRKMQDELETNCELSAIQKLERLLCALPENYFNIGLNRIYELAEKYPKPYRYLMSSVNHGWDLAEKYLRLGIENDEIRDVSIPVVMSMVKGTVRCYMESRVLYENDLTYEQGKLEMVRILMKGIEVN